MQNQAKRSRLLLSAVWSGALLLLPVPMACATDLFDLPLESLIQIEYEVSSASKFTQTTSRAPTAVQVIDAEAIRRHGWRTLGDMLNSLSGVITGSDRGYDYFGVRGFQQSKEFNHRFLLAIDGQRINDAVYEQAMIGDEFPLDVALIERVEFVDGPGSSIYGANAIFGVINVITRRTSRMTNSARLSLSSDGWKTLSGSASSRLDNDSALTLGLSLGNKAGRDQSYSAPPGFLTLADGTSLNDGVAQGLDRTGMAKLFARWEMNDTELTLTHGTRRHHPSAPIYEALFNDPALYLEDNNSRLSLSGKRELTQDVELRGFIAYNRISFIGEYPYFDAVAGRYINRDQTDARWWAGEGYVVYGGLEHHKLVGGISFQQETRARQQNFDLQNANVNTPPLDVDTSARMLGVYLQDEWALAPGLLANLGLRHDMHSRYGGSTNPRLALIWQPLDGSSFKLMSGQAYRNPTAFEAAYGVGTAVLPNPVLQPESIHTLQLVAEQKIGEASQIAATLFRYRINGLIAQASPAPGVVQYQNSSTLMAHGADIAIRHRRADGLMLDASLAGQDIVDALGVHYDNTPHWSAKFKASQPLAGDALLLAGELRLIGKRNFVWADGVSRKLPLEPVMDVTLSAPHLAGGLSAQIKVNNLFNRQSFVAASPDTMVPLIPIFGRTIWLNLSYAY